MKEVLKEPIVEACSRCDRITQSKQIQVCKVYLVPEAMWRNKNCLMATHIEKKVIKEEKKLNPLKKSKRSMKKK